MGEQIKLLEVAPKVKVKKERPRAGPGLEGITWVRCAVCNRPIHDEISKLRKIGPTCFRKQLIAKTTKNTERNQGDLQNQLTLFSNGPAPVNMPADSPILTEYGF